MGLYKVLLVDDEEDIRVGISRKMDWSGLGFELVGEAENGRDALELAEQHLHAPTSVRKVIFHVFKDIDAAICRDLLRTN